MTTLIVNGDDFGLTPGVNAGILAAHTRGLLTSASLFANRAATDEAIAIAKRTPTLGVGCHLTLVDGVPVLPPSIIPTLASHRNPNGARVFPPTWGAFISAVLTRRIRLAEIERELTAQIERLASAGILLTHLDAHKHVYAFPPVFAMVVRLASRFGVAAIRVPHERPSARVLWRYRATPGARRQAFENLVLGPWASTGRRLLARHGLSAAPRFHGRALTGLWTRERFRDFLGRLPQGRHELMMHPGYVDPALDALPTRLREQRAEEVDVLTDPVALELIERRGIVLARHDRPSVHRVVCHSHAS